MIRAWAPLNTERRKHGFPIFRSTLMDITKNNFHAQEPETATIKGRRPRAMIATLEPINPPLTVFPGSIVTIRLQSASRSLLFRMSELSCPPGRRIEIEAGVDAKR